jgi:hypothetical protein
LLALDKSFSAFFALANADLADFSALTLAVVEASKAILEAVSLASRDTIRALATFRAPEANKEERKSQAKKQGQACIDKQVSKNETYLQRPWQLLGTQRSHCPSQQISSSGPVQKIGCEHQHVKSLSKYNSVFTHVVGGACGLMGLKGGTDTGSFLQALRAATVTTFLVGFFKAF